MNNIFCVPTSIVSFMKSFFNVEMEICLCQIAAAIESNESNAYMACTK